MTPEISIIIINYNSAELTMQCVQSVRQKTVDVAYEIIIVDNGSDASDVEQLRSLEGPVRLVENAENLGFAKGNNLGIQHADAPYILLLNSDTELIDNAVSVAFQKLKSDSTIGAITVKTVFPDGRVQYVSNRFKTLGRQLAELTRFHKVSGAKAGPHQLIREDREHDTGWIWGSFFMFRKTLLSKFPGGKLHEDFFMYGEDRLWCHYIHKLGLKVRYTPEATIIHHVSASATPGSNEQTKFERYILPNEYRTFVMMHGKAYAIAYYLTAALTFLTWCNKKGWQRFLFYFRFALRNVFKTLAT